MTHNSRCGFAEGSKCNCSCGGSLHGGGGGVIRGKSNFSSKAEKIGIKVASSTIKKILIPTISPIIPWIIPIYASYEVIKFGKSIYDACNSKDFWKDFKEISINIIQDKVSEQERIYLNEKVTDISHKIRVLSESSQILKNISKEARIDERIYGEMLEGSIKNGIISGINTITSFAIGGILNG